MVAQCPFEIGACCLARIQRGFELGTAGTAAITLQRGGHALAGGTIVEDPIAVLVHQRALHAVALVLAVHQLHGQVVVHLPAVGTRPVAATHGVHDLDGTFTHGAATLVVIGEDVGERLVAIGEAEQREHLVVGAAPVELAAPERIIGLALVEAGPGKNNRSCTSAPEANTFSALRL
ncbi:hypothetical protein G6F59_015319 [Rhizopus arrhizus]|nr:hypothetical protein G6F59_015319 [Rhizopus arrhizus]